MRNLRFMKVKFICFEHNVPRLLLLELVKSILKTSMKGILLGASHFFRPEISALYRRRNSFRTVTRLVEESWIVKFLPFIKTFSGGVVNQDVAFQFLKLG